MEEEEEEEVVVVETTVDKEDNVVDPKVDNVAREEEDGVGWCWW